MLTHAEHRHDIRVVQLCRSPGFALESLQRSGVEQCGLGQHLDRDVPRERFLLGLVDDSHAAAADLADDAEVAELCRHPGRSDGRTAVLLAAQGDLFHGLNRREEFADLLGALGMGRFVLGDRRRLAAAKSLRRTRPTGVFDQSSEDRSFEACLRLESGDGQQHRAEPRQGPHVAPAGGGLLHPQAAATSSLVSCSKCRRTSTSRSISSMSARAISICRAVSSRMAAWLGDVRLPARYAASATELAWGDPQGQQRNVAAGVAHICAPKCRRWKSISVSSTTPAATRTRGRWVRPGSAAAACGLPGTPPAIRRPHPRVPTDVDRVAFPRSAAVGGHAPSGRRPGPDRRHGANDRFESAPQESA